MIYACQARDQLLIPTDVKYPSGAKPKPTNEPPSRPGPRCTVSQPRCLRVFN